MKALITTSVASMVDQFLKPSIKILQNIGYEVVVATNFDNCGNITRERCETLKTFLRENNIQYEQVDFPRNPLKVRQIISSYKQINKIVNCTDYHLCHCHSPIGGLVTRFACKGLRKKGLKVIYTAHGFHFYKGAPLKNWLVYYPTEWLCAFWTDILITINREDFERAKKHMHAKKVEYVPGVGIDVDKFKNTTVDKSAKRREIGVPEDAFLLLSVGELNKNKNHEVVIKALAQLNNKNIHYAIAGQGKLKDYLLNLAKDLNIEDQVHLLGFRTDVAELYKIANVYIHPSFREGLPVSVMEAEASGILVLGSNIRGNRDLIVKDRLFSPSNSFELRSQLKRCLYLKKTDLIDISWFDFQQVNNKMLSIYEDLTL